MANTFMTNVPDAFTLEYLGQELTKAFQQKGYIVTTALSGTDNLRVRLEKKTVAGSIYSWGSGKGLPQAAHSKTIRSSLTIWKVIGSGKSSAWLSVGFSALSHLSPPLLDVSSK